MLQQFSVDGFGKYQQRWEAMDAYRGKPVAIHAGSQVTRGVARGVDATGGLRLETASGLEIFKGGELSLRGVE